MRRILVLASFLALGVGGAVAQDAIAARKALFKEMGAAAGPIGKMLRGEDAFDLAKVKAGLDLLGKNAKALPANFPENSKTGDTKALPVIWDNKPKFEGLFAKLASDAAAASAAIKDEASFKAEMGKVLGNCGACHNDFRAK